MTIHSPFLLGLAAFVLTACVMAGAVTTVDPATGRNDPSSSLRCVLNASDSGGSVTFEGQVEAGEPMTGTYAMTLRRNGGGASVDQSGDFSALPGMPVSLGMAQLTGQAADYDASLTIGEGGRLVVCPLIQM